MTKARGDSLARGIASNWATVVLAVVVAFFMSPFVVNKLGSVYYGIWALTLQFTGYLNLLDFGVREAVVRYTSKYAARRRPDTLNRVLGTALLTYAPIVATALMITGVSVWAVPGPFAIDPPYHTATRWAVLFTGLTIANALFFNVFTGIIMGVRRFDVANIISVVSLLARSASIVILLSNGYGLVALAATQFGFALLEGIATAVAAARLLRSRGIPLSPKLPRGRQLPAMMRRVFGYGVYALIHSIGQKIIFASDTLIVGAFVSISAVTPYSIAGSLVQYLRTLLMSTVRVFVPATSELHARGEHALLTRLITRAARLATLVVIPVAVVYAVLGEQFVRLWMGPSIARDANSVLLVLAITQIFSAPSNVLVSALYGTSKHRAVSLMRILEASINITLSIVLALRFGSIGVALGTAISHILLVVVVMPQFACRQLNLRRSDYLINAYLRPAVTAGPLVAAALLLREEVTFESLPAFFAAIAALMLVYASSVYLIGLEPQERADLTRQIGGRLAARKA